MSLKQANEIRKRLHEPVYVLPVMKRAIKFLGYDTVLHLVEEAEEQFGMEMTSEGVFRTVGGIFLKKLKQFPDRKRFFGRKKRRRTYKKVMMEIDTQSQSLQ